MNGDSDLSVEIASIKERLAVIETNCQWFSKMDRLIIGLLFAVLGINVYPLVI